LISFFIFSPCFRFSLDGGEIDRQETPSTLELEDQEIIECNIVSLGKPLFGQQPFGQNRAPAFGRETPAFGSGTPAFGSGTPAFGSGTPAFGRGTPAFGRGTPAFGASSFGRGRPPPVPPGPSGPSSFGRGRVPAFGRRPPQSGSTAGVFNSKESKEEATVRIETKTETKTETKSETKTETNNLFLNNSGTKKAVSNNDQSLILSVGSWPLDTVTTTDWSGSIYSLRLWRGGKSSGELLLVLLDLLLDLLLDFLLTLLHAFFWDFFVLFHSSSRFVCPSLLRPWKSKRCCWKRK
jgi:hypothetical protein